MDNWIASAKDLIESLQLLVSRSDKRAPSERGREVFLGLLRKTAADAEPLDAEAMLDWIAENQVDIAFSIDGRWVVSGVDDHEDADLRTAIRSAMRECEIPNDSDREIPQSEGGAA